MRNNNVDLVPNSKILIMTNFEQDEASRKSVMSRVDGYLIKADITPRNLIDVVKQMSSDD